MKIVLFALVLFPFLLPSQEFVLAPDGSMSCGTLQWSFHRFAPGWKNIRLTRNTSPAKADAVWTRNGNTLDLDCRIIFPEPAESLLLFGNLNIPFHTCERILFDGIPLTLPDRFSKQTLFHRKVREVLLSLPGGRELRIVSSEPRGVQLLDSRAFGQEQFSLRFECTPAKGTASSATLFLRFTLISARSFPVDLSTAANSSFRDEREGDGYGWTDQGPGNDLRAFHKTALSLGALSFRILPATAENNCLILAGKQRGFGSPEAAIHTLPGEKAKTLLLLHASAWTPKPGRQLGEITVRSRSGKRQVIPVRAGIDCGNWWMPFSVSNAHVLWSAENVSAVTGLYISAFPLEFDDPGTLSFRMTSDSAAWMIAAVSLADRTVQLPVKQSRPDVIREGKEWVRLDFSRTTRPGSALDFSFLQDAPAGKYGAVRVAENGTLTFEHAPEKRLRLHGVNLCFSSNYLERNEADALAAELVRCGYNAVRFHHHDTLLSDPDSPVSTDLNRRNLDKLDYLFYRLKQSGIYMTTDLYTNRRFRKGDNIPELSPENDSMKKLIAVSPRAMENWKQFVRNWMTHVNPYTGIAWGEDPALFCLNLVNENELTFDNTLYRSRYRVWCTGNPAKTGESPEQHYRRFLTDLQLRTIRVQMRFLKEELKLKPLLTDLNYRNKRNMTLIRSHLDLVDNHEYFDHPKFPEKAWSYPVRHTQGSSIRLNAVVPRRIMATRLWGKPFIITEYNFTYPNMFRAESVPLMYSYAALQNWDGLFRFAWSHGRSYMTAPFQIRMFDAVNDPLALLADRLAAALFLRGDIAPARNRCAFGVSPEEAGSNAEFSAESLEAGLVSQIGSYVRGTVTPDCPEPALSAIRRTGTIVSDTGELRLAARNGTFAAVSPKTESLTLPGGALSGKILHVRNASCFQTVAAISLDNKPLANSASILLLHLTNTENSGTRFDDASRRLMRKAGELPLLVLRGSAEIRLKNIGRPFRVRALSCDGTELGDIKASLQDGFLHFRIATDLFSGGVMAYHLTRSTP